MTGPSSTPRPEHTPRPGVTWQTQLVRVETVIEDDLVHVDPVNEDASDTAGPDMNQPLPPRPNRATRRAMQRAARRNR